MPSQAQPDLVSPRPPESSSGSMLGARPSDARRGHGMRVKPSSTREPIHAERHGRQKACSSFRQPVSE